MKKILNFLIQHAYGILVIVLLLDFITICINFQHDLPNSLLITMSFLTAASLLLLVENKKKS